MNIATFIPLRGFAVVEKAIRQFNTRTHFVLFLFLMGTPAVAGPFPLKQFSICYSSLTDLRLPTDHPLIAAVSSGSLSPIDACMSIFNKAMLVSSGPHAGKTLGEASGNALNTQEARAVLQKFHNFHRSWFPSQDYTTALLNRFYLGEHDIHDPSEAANHLSYILFTPDAPYRNLVTGVRTIEAVRSLGRPSVGRVTGRSRSSFKHHALFSAATLLEFPSFMPNLLQVGELQGFRALSSEEQDVSLWADSWFRPMQDVISGIPTVLEWEMEVKYKRSYGAGALGTHSYLMLNSGFTQARGISDGGVSAPRRFSTAVFKEFLCRDLPVARRALTSPYIRPQSGIPFRQSETCMQCHASIDAMAGAIRNFALVSALFHDHRAYNSFHIAELPTSRITDTTQRTDKTKYLPVETDIFGRDSDTTYGHSLFASRPPNGRFIYTAYDGIDYDQSIYGIEGLGEVLASTDDLYICAAKRYAELLIDSPPIDLSTPSANPSVNEFRQSIIQWGKELRQSQNLSQMLRQILTSSAYWGGVRE